MARRPSNDARGARSGRNKSPSPVLEEREQGGRFNSNRNRDDRRCDDRRGGGSGDADGSRKGDKFGGSERDAAMKDKLQKAGAHDIPSTSSGAARRSSSSSSASGSAKKPDDTCVHKSDAERPSATSGDPAAELSRTNRADAENDGGGVSRGTEKASTGYVRDDRRDSWISTTSGGSSSSSENWLAKQPDYHDYPTYYTIKIDNLPEEMSWYELKTLAQQFVEAEINFAKAFVEKRPRDGGGIVEGTPDFVCVSDTVVRKLLDKSELLNVAVRGFSVASPVQFSKQLCGTLA